MDQRTAEFLSAAGISGRPGSARRRDRSRERTSSSSTAGWVRLLTQAPAGTSIAVVVPVPLDGGGAAKGALLREAIEKVTKGE